MESTSKKPSPWEYGVVLLLLAAAFFLILLTSSCGTSRESLKDTRIEYRDTTINNYWKKDTTIHVDLPIEQGKVVTMIGDTAKAQTSIASAAAWVDDAGRLHLELENRSDKGIDVIAPVYGRTIYTSVTDYKSEQLKPPPVYVEKELTWWQRFRLKAFWPLVLAVVLLLLWTFRKLFL